MSEPPVVPYESPLTEPPPPTLGQVLRILTPKIYLTWVILAANVAIYLAMAAMGAGLGEPSNDLLLKWGANFGPLTTNGQWWRLFTCMFVHIGPVHIFMNMLVFYWVAPLVERMLGNIGFAVTYLAAGLCGSLASLYWNPWTVSAGASGAIFGLYGALMGFVVLRRDSLPKPLITNILRSAAVFVGYNVFFGMTQPNIDMAAHIGGLIGGLLCGLIMSHRFTPEAGTTRLVKSGTTAVVLGIAIVLAGSRAPTVPDADAIRTEFDKVHRAALQGFDDAGDQARAHKLNAQQYADVLQNQVIPPWNAELAKIQLAAQQIRHWPKQAALAQFDEIAQYMQARRESWQLRIDANRKHTDALDKQIDAADQKADQLGVQADVWKKPSP